MSQHPHHGEQEARSTQICILCGEEIHRGDRIDWFDDADTYSFVHPKCKAKWKRLK